MKRDMLSRRRDGTMWTEAPKRGIGRGTGSWVSETATKTLLLFISPVDQGWATFFPPRTGTVAENWTQRLNSVLPNISCITSYKYDFH